MTEQQLQQWAELKDYQVTLKALVAETPEGLGISLQDVATAILDGEAPANAVEISFLPIVQAAIDRISRARLTVALSRLSDVLEKVEGALAKPKKAPQGAARPLVAGKAASVVPPGRTQA